MDKLRYLPSQGKVSYTSDFNPAIGDTIKIWDARDFIAAATLFIPPQGVWKEAHGVENDDSRPQPPPCTVPESACRSLGRQPFRRKRREPAWARLIAKVYEIDLLICPRCSSKMRVLAVITNPAEVKKILRHLIKIGCPPPGLDPALLN